MQVAGITWHAITLEAEPFAATKKLMTGTFGLTPAVDMDGFTMFAMPNGSMLELYAPQAVPSYGYNEGVAFGFRVDDIEAAVREVEAAGCDVLSSITRMAEISYAFCHFRGPDGRVYGLNEQKTLAQ